VDVEGDGLRTDAERRNTDPDEERKLVRA